MKFPVRFAVVLLLTFSSLTSADVAVARTLNSSMYFEGNYNGRKIYGVLNDWDGRACTIINNKVVLGRVSKEDRLLLPQKREILITDRFLLNPFGSSQIPNTWRKKPQFDDCYTRMLKAECFLPSGVKYYSPDNEFFRNITQSQIPVFVLGSSTNIYTRDNEVDSQDWAYFSLTKRSNGGDFIVNYHELQCRKKL
jgi:hypothetical protein